MNLSRCANGHFFDKDKYAVCPHCSNNASDESLTTVFTEDAAVQQKQAKQNVFGGNSMGNFSQMGAFPVADLDADQFTVELDQAAADSMTVPLEQPVSAMDFGRGAGEDDDHTVGFFDNDLFGAPVSKSVQQSSLAAAQTTVRHTASAQQEVTASPAAVPEQTRNVTRPVNKVSTPCVGWLIALNGEHVGTDFRLKVGKNFIGRNPQMDIALTEDKSVSRDKHAIVVYEPKAHLYLMQPGESSSLVYKNDEVVLSPVNLAAYDKITVGEVDLLFMPLCGKEFNWSDWFEKTKKRGNE